MNDDDYSEWVHSLAITTSDMILCTTWMFGTHDDLDKKNVLHSRRYERRRCNSIEDHKSK